MSTYTIRPTPSGENVEFQSPRSTFGVGYDDQETGHDVIVFGPLEHDPVINDGDPNHPMLKLSMDTINGLRNETTHTLAKAALAAAAEIWPDRYGPEGTGAPEELTVLARQVTSDAEGKG